ncbi:MAG TPA: TIGR04282 family arsenosugar biosynthesis glycosyltransferase [Desulfuromonadaceae bacterium]
MNGGLVIFAREPVPGRVKTRLAGAMGDPAAAELYAAMLADVLEQAVAIPGVRPFLFWDCGATNIPVLPGPLPGEQFIQEGDDLGRRMANAFGRTFGRGFDACCIIGSDSPDLPPAYIRRAFELLERGAGDAVFGPADDGGYYLIGLRRPCPGLLEEIAWGTSEVLEASLERARGLGLRTSLLEPWYDIDTMGDLRRLLDSPGSSAPRTRRAAARLLGRGTRRPER